MLVENGLHTDLEVVDQEGLEPKIQVELAVCMALVAVEVFLPELRLLAVTEQQGLSLSPTHQQALLRQLV